MQISSQTKCVLTTLVPKLLSDGVVEKMFPLHNHDDLAKLRKTWVSAFFKKQPLGEFTYGHVSSDHKSQEVTLRTSTELEEFNTTTFFYRNWSLMLPQVKRQIWQGKIKTPGSTRSE